MVKHTLGPACWAIAGMMGLAATGATAQTVVHLPPRATYLRTNQDTATDAVPILLSTLGVSAGDRLRIHIGGEYVYVASGLTSRSTNAVFSSTSTLLAQSVQARVPGAIAAGESFVTIPTFNGNLATDIPEDFRVASSLQMDTVVVPVPPGAVYVFVAAADSLYRDNTDTDNNYVAEFTRLPSCVADVDDGTGMGLPDGGVTIDDLLYYLQIFESGVVGADVDDGSGTGTRDGGVTIDDLLYYLARFEAGC